MPQFNPEDGNLLNHGVPLRLLEYLSVKMDIEALSALPFLLKQEIVHGSLSKQDWEPLKVSGLIPNPAFQHFWETIEDFSNELTRQTSWLPVKGNVPFLQYFDDGNDFISWNRGTGGLLSGHPEAIMASFGAARVLDIRYRKDPSVVFSIKLKNGTALHLKSPLTEEYDIRIPRMKGDIGPMICILYPKATVS